MENQIAARLTSFLVGLALAGSVFAQAPSPGSGGVVEFFQPDPQEFSGAADALTDESPDADLSRGLLVLVNTATNRLFVTSGGKVIFQAPCSTGKGTTLTTGGEKHVFATPKGNFLVQSKEENPSWVPPDWYFIEEAKKRGLGIRRIQPGQSIPIGSGAGFLLASNGSSSAGPHLEVRRGAVMSVSGSTARELPPGKLILVGDAIVIPPYGTRQRRFERVLGAYRIDFGGGFGIHGTDEPGKIGQSVTHGCVRLSDEDIRALYPLVEVGDEVVIF